MKPKERMTRYPLDIAYSDYIEFMNRNTERIRDLLPSSKSRAFFDENARTAILPFAEFERRVNAMPQERRAQFLCRISAGYDWALCTWARDDAESLLRVA